MKLTITNQDLKKSIHGEYHSYLDGRHCPFHEAVVRQLPDIGKIYVSPSLIHKDDKEYTTIGKIDPAFSSTEYNQLVTAVQSGQDYLFEAELTLL